MPTYKDGETPARIGDRVRGNGVEGIVTAVGAEHSCQRGQIAVAVLRVAESDYCGMALHMRSDGPRLVIATEYGAAREFEKIG